MWDNVYLILAQPALSEAAVASTVFLQELEKGVCESHGPAAVCQEFP